MSSQPNDINLCKSHFSHTKAFDNLAAIRYFNFSIQDIQLHSTQFSLIRFSSNSKLNEQINCINMIDLDQFKKHPVNSKHYSPKSKFPQEQNLSKRRISIDFDVGNKKLLRQRLRKMGFKGGKFRSKLNKSVEYQYNGMLAPGPQHDIKYNYKPTNQDIQYQETANRKYGFTECYQQSRQRMNNSLSPSPRYLSPEVVNKSNCYSPSSLQAREILQYTKKVRYSKEQYNSELKYHLNELINSENQRSVERLDKFNKRQIFNSDLNNLRSESIKNIHLHDQKLHLQQKLALKYKQQASTYQQVSFSPQSSCKNIDLAKIAISDRYTKLLYPQLDYQNMHISQIRQQVNQNMKKRRKQSRSPAWTKDIKLYNFKQANLLYSSYSRDCYNQTKNTMLWRSKELNYGSASFSGGVYDIAFPLDTFFQETS